MRPIAPTERTSVDGPRRNDFLDLVKGLTPGWYTSRMLYPRYLVWAENNMHEPVGMHSLGARLRAFVGNENVKVLSDKQRAFRFTADLIESSG